MQAYFGEQTHFDEVSTIMDSNLGRDQKASEGVEVRLKANMAANLLDHELMWITRKHTKNACTFFYRLTLKTQSLFCDSQVILDNLLFVVLIKQLP